MQTLRFPQIILIFEKYFYLPNLECHCHEQGSKHHICSREKETLGNCECKSELIVGQQCDRSKDGYWDFPNPQGKKVSESKLWVFLNANKLFIYRVQV